MAGLEGLAAYQAGLKQARHLPKQTAKVERTVATRVRGASRTRASADGGMEGHFASKITSGADRKGGWVGIRGIAAGAFYGANPNTRAGWNAGYRNGEKRPRRYLGGKPQFPRKAIGGPRAVTPAIKAEERFIVATYLHDVIDVPFAAAYPEG